MLIKKMLRRGRRWGLQLEAALTLAYYQWRIRRLPHQKWGFGDCHYQCETLYEDIQTRRALLSAITHAIYTTAPRLPWKSRCLDQALAAQHMLARRRLSSTLYLGMYKFEQSSQTSWQAHAWLRCGDYWVVGYQAEQPYTTVATYARIIPS